MRRWLPALCALALAALLGGCASLPAGAPAHDTSAATLERRGAELAAAIAALGERVDPQEAKRVARVAIEYPLTLASDYELTTPPLWHNTLVNLGVKPRGLCVHWTRDLLLRLGELRLRTLKLHWGVANYEAVFRIEHSTAIVSARGRPLAEGIVLDPWRDSGWLYWSRVVDDTEYRWRPLAEVQAARRQKKLLAAERTDTRR